MEEEPVFSESELKGELERLGHNAGVVIVEEEPGSSSDRNEMPSHHGEEQELERFYVQFRHDLVAQEESADEILGDINNDTAEEEEYEEVSEDEGSSSTSSVGSVIEKEELTAGDLDFPPILEEGTPKILPENLLNVLESFREEIKHTVGTKGYADLTPKERKTAEGVIQKWMKESPVVSEEVEEQLKTELLAFSLVNCALRKNHGGDMEDESDEEESRPPLFSKLGVLSDLFTKRGRDSNLVSKLVGALREHECFEKYRSYLDSLSDEQVSTLVWDCSMETQRVIVRLTKLHESVLSAIEKLGKLNWEASEAAKRETELLATATRREAEKNILTLDTNELTTKGRKSMIRSFTAPYFKTPDGFAAPEWNPYPLPFKYEQLRVAPISDAELEVLQVSVLQAVIEAKQNQVADRCNQLLLKRGRGEVVEQRVNTEGYPFELQVLCPAEDLLRWKAECIKEAERTTLEDIAKNPHIRINWFSVADKMNKQTIRYYWPDECERIWDKLLLPRITKNRQMTFEELQKLMELVKKYGTQKWTIISKEMGYSAYQCFTAFEAFREGEMGAEERPIRKQANIMSGVNKFKKIVNLAKEFQPHVSKSTLMSLGSKVTEIMFDVPNVPLQTLAEQYMRFVRPDQKGQFKLVEDLLLMVCMVKMRDYLMIAKSFTPIKDYLPWRFVSAWACRAEILFGPRCTLWSRDEDVKLLELVKSHGRFDWRLFSHELGGDKNRKSVRRRYMQLLTRLRYDTFENIRREYESHSRQPLYTAFQKYIPPLKTALSRPQGDPPTYEELSNSPDEVLLFKYLESFDKWVIQETIQDLESVVRISAEKEKEVPLNMIEEPAPSRPFVKPDTDRRKFIRGDTASTASVIHLRKLELKPRHLVQPLSQFEEEVYDYFEYYSTRPAKTATKHRYLPTADKLYRFPEIKRILVVPQALGQENIEGSDAEIDDTPLDSKGFPILSPAKQTKGGPKKPRKRRGIALVNLAKAHERRKKAREAEKSGGEGACGTTPDNRDDDAHLDGEREDSEYHSNEDGNEGDLENEIEVRSVGHQQCEISDGQERPLVTPEVTVILKPEHSDRYEYEDT